VNVNVYGRIDLGLAVFYTEERGVSWALAPVYVMGGGWRIPFVPLACALARVNPPTR
jgi:hypothetical protein